MADFWAGYISGATGIVIGSPLDIVKLRFQAGPSSSLQRQNYYSFRSAGSLVRGSAAPILGYGALNALLFVSYNRTLEMFGETPSAPSNLWKIWTAGAVGGLACFVVSAPTELIKCKTQISTSQTTTSWSLTKQIFHRHGIRGFYYGGTVTSLRDSLGYGFYFWAYEGLKSFLSSSPADNNVNQQPATIHLLTTATTTAALKTLFCGGVAGCVTWLSVYPLDVIKTRVQTQETLSLLPPETERAQRLGAWGCAKKTYREDGARVFFSGLGVCMARAFIVNAVQWAVYEYAMHAIQSAGKTPHAQEHVL